MRLILFTRELSCIIASHYHLGLMIILFSMNILTYLLMSLGMLYISDLTLLLTVMAVALHLQPLVHWMVEEGAWLFKDTTKSGTLFWYIPSLVGSQLKPYDTCTCTCSSSSDFRQADIDIWYKAATGYTYVLVWCKDNWLQCPFLFEQGSWTDSY